MLHFSLCSVISSHFRRSKWDKIRAMAERWLRRRGATLRYNECLHTYVCPQMERLFFFFFWWLDLWQNPLFLDTRYQHFSGGMSGSSSQSTPISEAMDWKIFVFSERNKYIKNITLFMCISLLFERTGMAEKQRNLCQFIQWSVQKWRESPQKFLVWIIFRLYLVQSFDWQLKTFAVILSQRVL